MHNAGKPQPASGSSGQRVAYGSFPQEPRQLNRLAAARALRDLYTPQGYGTEAGVGPHAPPSEPEQTEATA